MNKIDGCGMSAEKRESVRTWVENCAVFWVFGVFLSVIVVFFAFIYVSLKPRIWSIDSGYQDLDLVGGFWGLVRTLRNKDIATYRF